jgi:acetyl-CoA acyltransferase
MRSNPRSAVILEAVRTPIGRGNPESGYYRDVHANELLGACYRAVIDRAEIDPAAVQDVIAGCVHQYGEQSANVARNAWLQAGLPVQTAAVTIDRACGSAQQAINFAATQIAAGAADVVIAAGVEHMSRVPIGVGDNWTDVVGTPHPPALLERHALINQGLAAELVCDLWELTRPELDELALRSHALAAQATREGRFEREIVPFGVNGDSHLVDQGIRLDTTREALAGLPPVFKHDGRITAGTSSQVSDGASAVLLTSLETAGELGLSPRARIVDQVAVGVDPVTMLTGPIPATQRILERNGLRIEDIDLFEVNEAFASVVAAWQREVGADLDRVNVNGGAMALGHPLGCSGARLVTTLLHELERSDGELGLVTMCCAGGLGTASLVQRL